MSTGARGLTVYLRRWCHLCDDLLAELSPLIESHGVVVHEIDIDEHPEFEDAYGEHVPVLCADDRELCRHRLDAGAVRAYLLESPA
ncbi:MAG: glutaredoxin family protein [Gammaproteobacteria bacterium]|nr:glutaredoxin family protein [Gammaproteobacteria bacterium]MBU0773104.1 glutaredoxin family protein [Gammaproteobacteria bacterium]MBU0855742.1 glutaredoxin family protein [Gammaproteobacteria bacterium]MBU1846989.1 glutaredoxin family protein [Gammaproteobacteria bacterium]